MTQIPAFPAVFGAPRCLMSNKSASSQYCCVLKHRLISRYRYTPDNVSGRINAVLISAARQIYFISAQICWRVNGRSFRVRKTAPAVIFCALAYRKSLRQSFWREEDNADFAFQCNFGPSFEKCLDSDIFHLAHADARRPDRLQD